MLARMEEKERRAPVGSDDTSRRVEALESGLLNVRSRLDGLERSSRAIETDVRTMKDQINSMQSSIQEILIILRYL
jgi:predicted  nucleic acid-binding Zn-ribbon protein